MSKLRIAMGDLRHNTIGRHSVFMPISIGYIASYTLSVVENDLVDIRFYDDPDQILGDIELWKPDIVGLSNYLWNSELSCLMFRFAKSKNRNTICVAGGPEFPKNKEEARKYLHGRQEIDFYAYAEGELAFAKLIKKILSNKGNSNLINELKKEPQDGFMHLAAGTKELVEGKSIPRIEDLDIIPSPYLSGLMDRYFDGKYAPSIQTARGCPFSCGFCHTGQQSFNNLAQFSIGRIKKELDYIAEKMSSYSNVLLSIVDSNFGMYHRDREIAKYIRALQDKYNWPNAFDVTTGKANYDLILEVAEILKNRMNVTCSVQSINPMTLEVIRRKNLPKEDYVRIQKEIKQRKMNSSAELIIPMPCETKESFFEAIKFVADAGVESIVPYTTMILKDTYLASKQCRQRYDFVTKFRIIPCQFGEYGQEKCFEVEEVCVGTNTMSFEDYLDCRGFALVSSLFSDELFDIAYLHLSENKISRYDFIFNLWNIIKSSDSSVSQLYKMYLEETKKELWDSKEMIYEFFERQENYQKLLRRELGDNLIRKYLTRALIELCSVIGQLKTGQSWAGQNRPLG